MFYDNSEKRLVIGKHIIECLRWGQGEGAGGRGQREIGGEQQAWNCCAVM